MPAVRHDPAQDAACRLDAVVIGGGVCGLWTLARLSRAGLAVALVERTALGHGQTIESQGIIHGGVKYALGGAASAASRSIAEMPGIWRACLAGKGELDLSAAEVLSESCTLWTARGIGSRVMGLAASKAIRVKPRSLTPTEAPEAFRSAPRGIDLYELPEPVLEPRSMLEALAAASDAPILLGEPTIEGDRVTVSHAGRSLAIEANRIVLCAGGGNEALLGGDPEIRMQRRPLHMVMARGRLPMLFGHCVGLSSKPLATITSQKMAGETVWWIGGQIAEDGVTQRPADLIERTRQELARLVPWVDLAGAALATSRIDRAEGLTADGSRPDAPVIREAGPLIACWPTKLAFAPAVAERVHQIVGTPSASPARLPADWPRPPVAMLPWEREGLAWS